MNKKTVNRRFEGDAVENEAVGFLQSEGVKILRKNYFCKTGEIDIVGTMKVPDIINPGIMTDVLIFFEVKYRKSQAADTAEAAVDLKKQKNICRVSDHYRMVNHIPEDTPVRFDVIAVNDKYISWYENAFEYVL